jgi:hypothetical protein
LASSGCGGDPMNKQRGIIPELFALALVADIKPD